MGWGQAVRHGAAERLAQVFLEVPLLVRQLQALRDLGIEDVVVLGVHLNRCVLGRPYGIRQLVYWGKRPLLCRDLTDSYHRDLAGHLEGNEQMIAYVERWWCPSITSDELVGGTAFQFQD